MLRIIFLLSPVYISLFWAIVLADSPKRHSVPRAFLGRFMLLPMIVYFTHFLYHAPLPEIYPYFDSVFAYASLFVFPMYYIYFRLLTVDEKFSIKLHGKYLIPGLIVGTLYTVGVILAPKAEYRVWLYNQYAFADTAPIKFLAYIRILAKITYLVQVLVTVIGNSLLIKKYGSKAEQYYSDILDGKNNNAKALNHSIITLSIAAFILGALGRYILLNHVWLIYSGWTVFSVVIFIVGYMGYKQKPINPTFEINNVVEEQYQIGDLTPDVQKKILHKLDIEFKQKKVYLNSQLNIMDVVEAIGTNRTYISLIINQQYNQNFCSFVNTYRIEELTKVYKEHPNLTTEVLAEKGGFGSISSMKRAIFNKTGQSLAEWKKTGK